MSTISLMPQLILLHLMEARDLKQSDLVGILGSKALPQKSSTEKEASVKPGQGSREHVSPALFL